MIRFKATSETQIGQLIRYRGKRAKFWKVVKIVDGIATAKAAGFGPTLCC